MTFETFQLNTTILKGVLNAGYHTPTPIQQQAMPPILDGRDVLGTAQTGTGKTAAFVLPMLQRLSLPGKKRRTVRALILAPTRELTEQTNQAVRNLGRLTKLRTVSIYGGVSIQPQIHTLNRGVDIVAACPGRLLDHLNRGTINLDNVEILVLDEADQMFDMGFLPDIKKIIRALPNTRQTLLFSATMPSAIRKLAGDVMCDPVAIQIGPQSPPNTVSHTFYAVESGGKSVLLKNILSDISSASVLVFTRTKHRAKQLAQTLEKTGCGATSLHGNLSQLKRQQALDGFKLGKYRVLVATDIAARGIDVADISFVINYDMPDTADAYTHRTGRTGRAERTGKAFSFVTRQDRGLVRSLEHVMGTKFTFNLSAESRDIFSAAAKPRAVKSAYHSKRRGKK